MTAVGGSAREHIIIPWLLQQQAELLSLLTMFHLKGWKAGEIGVKKLKKSFIKICLML